MLARRPTLPRRHPRRRGAVIVESAFVLSIFLLMIFGIFEYCRYLLVLHVATNAARDGARYASVNTDKPNTFDTVDFTDANAKVYPSITKYTNGLLANTAQNINGLAIVVYPCDPVALAQTPPVVQGKSPRTGWNDAAFPGKIAVRIQGQYVPLLPSFLSMPTSITVDITSVIGSEG